MCFIWARMDCLTLSCSWREGFSSGNAVAHSVVKRWESLLLLLSLTPVLLHFFVGSFLASVCPLPVAHRFLPPWSSSPLVLLSLREKRRR